MSDNVTPVPVPKTPLFKGKTAGSLSTSTSAGAPVPVPVPAQGIAKPKKSKTPKPAPAATVWTPAATLATPAPVPAPASILDVPNPETGANMTPAGIPLISGGTVYKIVIPSELAEKIKKPVTGMGGWQRLMIELAGLTHLTDPDPVTGSAWVLSVSPFLLDRLITKATKHGNGGYQAVIRWILVLALAQHKTAILGGK